MGVSGSARVAMECRPVGASTAERVIVLARAGVGLVIFNHRPIFDRALFLPSGSLRWWTSWSSTVGGLFGLHRFSKLVFHPPSDQCIAEQSEEKVDNKIVLAA